MIHEFKCILIWQGKVVELETHLKLKANMIDN